MAKNTKARLERVRGQVAERLTAVCLQEQQRATALQPLYGRLWQSITVQAAGGGKRLRPYLVVLAHEAYGGTADVIDIASAWELLHIGLLMHDDVVDQDYSRHGQPNIAGQYCDYYTAISQPQRNHHAQSAQLLAGDLVMAAAHRLLDQAGASRELKEIFYEAQFQVLGGELLDMEAGISPTLVDLQLIAETKTASYSLIGPLLSGALLAGAAASQLQMLRELGRILGIGFQLADDLLVFGDEATIGKSVDSDLAEGKRTMVTVEGFKLLPEADRQRAEKLLAAANHQNVLELRQILAKTNILNVLSIKLDGLAAEAQQLVSQLDIAATLQLEFLAMIKALLYRDA